MTDYHFRRPEKMLTDRAEMLDIIARQKYMTLALCKDNVPYLATVNYAYDAEHECFYFHSAPHGKKVEYLKANPAVWGEIVEDRGYVTGRCDHAYRSVHFAGQTAFVEDMDEKFHALALMVDQLEADPGPVKERLLVENRVAGVAIGRVRVAQMTGKENK